MYKAFFLLLISFVASSDIILIGDNRLVDMADSLFNYELEQALCDAVRRKSYTKEPISYEEYNIEIIGGPMSCFSNSNSGQFQQVHDKLKNAKDGTNVFFTGGIESMGSFNDIFVFYGKLADKYTKLNFYVVPLIGVDENLSNIKNENIKEFNKEMSLKLEMLDFPNMKYKNILKEDDPTILLLEEQELDIIKYVTKGIGFFKKGYEFILKAMLEGL